MTQRMNVTLTTLHSSQSHQPQNPFPAYDSNPITELFSFRNVDDLEVLNAISRVKFMVTGLDGIPLKFIKLILPLILPFFTYVLCSQNPGKSRKSFPSLNSKIHHHQVTTVLSASFPACQRPLKSL
jgi:hypothetical protein